MLGIVGTGFAYVLNYQIIASEGATIASTVTYLLPVVAIALGVLVLDETIAVIVLAGIALVLAGVALTRHRAIGQAGTPPIIMSPGQRLCPADLDPSDQRSHDRTSPNRTLAITGGCR